MGHKKEGISIIADFQVLEGNQGDTLIAAGPSECSVAIAGDNIGTAV